MTVAALDDDDNLVRDGVVVVAVTEGGMIVEEM